MALVRYFDLNWVPIVKMREILLNFIYLIYETILCCGKNQRTIEFSIMDNEYLVESDVDKEIDF